MSAKKPSIFGVTINAYRLGYREPWHESDEPMEALRVAREEGQTP